MKIKEKIADLVQTLAKAEIDDPRREIRLIVKYAAGIDEVSQVVRPEQELSPDQIEAIDQMAIRRAAGEPLSRILGTREFYGLAFRLSPYTLDPRPETEILVDRAIEWIGNRSENLTILDLGTGTGCIPISILKSCAQVRAVAIDVSADSLAVAAENARLHGVNDRLALIQSDWFSALSGVSFDLVVSNPPYIPAADVSNLEAAVRRFDPILALSGGIDGLDPYRTIFSTLHRYLKPEGLGLFEIGVGQRGDITRLATKSGLDVVQVWDDYAGIPRLVGVAVHRS